MNTIRNIDIENECNLDYKINLVKIRKANKLTKTELASRAKLSRRTIADVEKGNVIPRFSTLLKIANVYDVSINELLTFGDENTSSFVLMNRGGGKPIEVVTGDTTQVLAIREPKCFWNYGYKN
jgi:transcriptional regulator with XRE-family HTH domain